MPSINQIIRNGRQEKQKKMKGKALGGCPALKGVVLKVFTRKPKKPNSAQRKVAKVKSSNGISIDSYIPGIGHSLKEHGIVLVRGGRVQDLPGVKYKCVRGKYELSPVANRMTSRSKYGAKKPIRK
jgi:small subunit ribosomal protein S12